METDYIKVEDVSSNHGEPRLMKLEDAKKCAICNRPYYNLDDEIIRRMEDQRYNLDGKPTKYYNSKILECPNCHYCNYELDELVSQRYKGPVEKRIELWNEYVSKYLSEKNGDLRKILILESQYGTSFGDTLKKIELLIEASWVCKDERASEFRQEAINLFERKRWEYENFALKVIDSLRQENEFDKARELLDTIKNPIDNKDAFVAERVLLNNNDNKEYTARDVLEKYSQEISQ